MTRRTIKVDYLARVEGEGSLFLDIEGGVVRAAELKIFEPPRFFEAFLRGRDLSEAPDITARICGICPVAYQMSSVHAMEKALGISVGGSLRLLRRLLYCGEWIESHALHIFMLHAPDFLGYTDGVALAKDHPDVVKAGLAIKKAGNEIVQLVGGREIHPINVKVGGFYRCPEEQELQALLPSLKKASEQARQSLKFCAGLPIPDFQRKYDFVSLRHPDEYPMNEGRLISSSGLDIDQQDFSDHFEEIHAARSNALHCVRKGGSSYLVGPLARYNLNFDRLPSDIQDQACASGLPELVTNPFQSILVRSVELIYALDEAIRIIQNYARPATPAVEYKPAAGTGAAITEAPRGILYHRYEIDAQGLIQKATITPPTSQNQLTIEEDLFDLATRNIDMEDARLGLLCEQSIRNYDPCISCATHFLKIKVDRK